MTDLAKLLKKKIFNIEPLDPSMLPVILELGHSTEEMVSVFVVFLVQ